MKKVLILSVFLCFPLLAHAELEFCNGGSCVHDGTVLLCPTSGSQVRCSPKQPVCVCECATTSNGPIAGNQCYKAKAKSGTRGNDNETRRPKRGPRIQSGPSDDGLAEFADFLELLN